MGKENSRRKGKSRTTLNYAPRQQSVPLPPPTPFPATAPPFVIPSAVEGSALRLSPATNVYTSSSIGHAEEPLFQQEWQESHSRQRSGCYRGPRSSVHPSSVRIPRGREAHSRSLDYAANEQTGSALEEGSNVPHSSQTRLEWATLQFLGFAQSPLRRICSLPASRKAEGGPLKPRLA